MMYSFSKQHNGFTLVETLVAVSILLLTIIGPMTVAQKSIKNAYFANEQSTAVFLAQEAIEAVRIARDLDAIDAYSQLGTPGTRNTGDWYTALCGTLPCTLSYDPIAGFAACSGLQNTCSDIQISDDVVYGRTGSTDTLFKRIIRIAQAGEAWSVTSTIEWQSSILGIQNVVLQTWVYDQYQRYEN